MKYTYYEKLPVNKSGIIEAWGFSWLEFVTSIPTPMFLVSTYKSNGKTNACMQSWSSFTTADKGRRFFVILSSVNKGGHLYQTLLEKKCAVINFLSVDLYDKAMATIRNNQWDADELSESGLTAVKAEKIDAPMVDESFMNLECKFVWEKEIVPGDDHVMACLEVVNVHMDEKFLDSRIEENGIIYNIHHPINPEKFTGKAHDYVGIVKPIVDTGEY